jgi:hypothetical protein
MKAAARRDYPVGRLSTKETIILILLPPSSRSPARISATTRSAASRSAAATMVNPRPPVTVVVEELLAGHPPRSASSTAHRLATRKKAATFWARECQIPDSRPRNQPNQYAVRFLTSHGGPATPTRRRARKDLYAAIRSWGIDGTRPWEDRWVCLGAVFISLGPLRSPRRG